MGEGLFVGTEKIQRCCITKTQLQLMKAKTWCSSYNVQVAQTVEECFFQVAQLVWKSYRQPGRSEKVSQKFVLVLIGGCSESGQFQGYPETIELFTSWDLEHHCRMECFTILQHILFLKELSLEIEGFIWEEIGTQQMLRRLVFPQIRFHKRNKSERRWRMGRTSSCPHAHDQGRRCIRWR